MSEMEVEASGERKEDETKEMEVDETKEEMELPRVDEELLKQVMEMGFAEVRARKALMAGAKNCEAALEWCLEHADDEDVDAPIEMVAKSSQPTTQGATVAKSIKCVETGKLFRSVEEAQRYAEKTGRTNFEECTEEKKPLTEEEKKQKAAELKALAARRRAEREGLEKVEEIDREKHRREQGKEMGKTKEELQKLQRQREIERVKREKLAEKKERERLRAEIAKDKAERRARGGKLAGKLGVEGYVPAAGREVDVSKLHEGKVVEKSTEAQPELSAEEKISKAIASLSRYKTGGDGGVALKTLAAYVRNAHDKGADDPKFLRIPTDGKAFKDRVAPLIGGVALLKAVGFSKTPDALVLQPDDRLANLALLKSTLDQLTNAHQAYLDAATS